LLDIEFLGLISEQEDGMCIYLPGSDVIKRFARKKSGGLDCDAMIVSDEWAEYDES